jgi:uncharacterized membrane protein
MKERPKIKLSLNTADKFWEIIGWIAIVGLWGLVIINYPTLPEVIPTHFNLSGDPDGFAKKVYILGLPLAASILFLGLTVLNRFPYLFNYPTLITTDNAVRQYKNATRLIRYLKLNIVIIFGLAVFKEIQRSSGERHALDVWFFPLVLGFILIPLGVYIVKSLKDR